MGFHEQRTTAVWGGRDVMSLKGWILIPSYARIIPIVRYQFSMEGESWDGV